MGTFDTIVVIVLFGIVIGFIYTKFLKPWLLPMLADMWHWLTKKPEVNDDDVRKELTFE